MSKGSKRRKQEVSAEKLDESWNAIFYGPKLTPEERAQIQKDLLEGANYKEGPYRTDH